MKKQQFREANSKCKLVYLSNVNNAIIMQFKPSIKEIMLLLLCYLFPFTKYTVWVGAPVRTRTQGQFSVSVAKTAFAKD